MYGELLLLATTHEVLRPGLSQTLKEGGSLRVVGSYYSVFHTRKCPIYVLGYKSVKSF